MRRRSKARTVLVVDQSLFVFLCVCLLLLFLFMVLIEILKRLTIACTQKLLVYYHQDIMVSSLGRGDACTS